MSEHTKGPWQFVPVEKFPFGFKVMAGDEEILSQDAVSWASGVKTREGCMDAIGFKASERPTIIAGLKSQDANGKLIAAAPELLEALQRIFSLLDPDIGGSKGSALENARAAIAKATK